MRPDFYKFEKFAAATVCLSIIALLLAWPLNKAEAQFLGAEPVIEIGPSAGFLSSISATTLITKAIDTVVAQATDLIVQKEYVYDAIAKATAKLLIRELSHSIVKWIQNGFDGRPLFIEDPAQFFENTADIASGVYLQSLFGQNAQLLCEPFRLSIQISLFSVTHEALPTCTVSKIIANVQQMYENFSVGGWQSLVSISTNVNNNAFGQILVAWDGLAAAITKKVADTRGKIILDKGFNVPGVCVGGWKKRIAGTNALLKERAAIISAEQGAIATGEASGLTTSSLTPAEAEIQAAGFSGAVEPGTEQVCERWGRGTPGAAIESQLINVFGETFQDLGVADEINEIIEALINQGITYLTTVGSPRGVFGSGATQPPFSATTPTSPAPSSPLEGKLKEALKEPITEGSGQTAGGEESQEQETGATAGNPIVSLTYELTGTNLAALNWTSVNASSCVASEGWTGAKSLSGSEEVSVSGTVGFVLTCAGAEGGSASDSVIIKY